MEKNMDGHTNGEAITLIISREDLEFLVGELSVLRFMVWRMKASATSNLARHMFSVYPRQRQRTWRTD